jgi:hypothetical protein
MESLLCDLCVIPVCVLKEALELSNIYVHVRGLLQNCRTRREREMVG